MSRRESGEEAVLGLSRAAVASGIVGGIRPLSPTRKSSWSTRIEGSNRRSSIAQLVFGNSTLVKGNSGQLRDWADNDVESAVSAGNSGQLRDWADNDVESAISAGEVFYL
ncbi:unnamed protein product [Strongylus vulgaris]|uniref:Uncharacterized protein n=1 Tax=Strongylus vulgaris TaxID=40348 RepID=A0A3P7J6D2_STRVU|nr:unnamed protein product [Strongylus vulgaris]